MRCTIFANGEYGELGAYRNISQKGDLILCADGGANYAYALGLVPACILGDLDSIKPEVKKYYETRKVEFRQFSPRKDFTDLQLTLEMAEARGADEIILLGSLGKRLDHTLASLYSGINTVRRGIRLSHYSPACRVYIVNREIVIEGQPGDIVSVFSLTDEAHGVKEVGFEYTANSVLENNKPYAISNVLVGRQGIIGVQSGILVVFHYTR
ncbi:MAG: thiamine diphosphokinase [Syntrophomonadaceae bacterium]|nr:thiamine diphosphokinase [Syntrophomonadaceae bacterium]